MYDAAIGLCVAGRRGTGVADCSGVPDSKVGDNQGGIDHRCISTFTGFLVPDMCCGEWFLTCDENAIIDVVQLRLDFVEDLPGGDVLDLDHGEELS